MFDIGFLELLICGVIALLVLGPERLPTAARTAGRWIGKTRRLVSQFSSELDRQLKAEELREQLRKAGDVGLDDVEKNVRSALDEAKKYQHMVLPDDQTRPPRPAPATRRLNRPDAETAGTKKEPDTNPEPGPYQGSGADTAPRTQAQPRDPGAQAEPERPHDSTPESRS
ncbi:MAG: Sec-independent protein translocase protein TatB [Marinobacter sp.]|uniref:Sec-independent protein translocase protein TatB n=1 Tax=Marinobacter sp. TaxID=50741 RepID=UPI00299D0419|nr:Sec-independent protein translocase protein TatB [Marinobacter sp.]MDX1633317.1 Sec-independent protein translocase protein TatB [Marinobacter sp.]